MQQMFFNTLSLVIVILLINKIKGKISDCYFYRNLSMRDGKITRVSKMAILETQGVKFICDVSYACACYL